jgi:hypothetical protein
MGWQRRNKSWYYYHTMYIQGHYFNLYCGGGAFGAAFERLVQWHRAETKEYRRLRAEIRAELHARRRARDTPPLRAPGPAKRARPEEPSPGTGTGG